MPEDLRNGSAEPQASASLPDGLSCLYLEIGFPAVAAALAVMTEPIASKAVEGLDKGPNPVFPLVRRDALTS
jgi:hypothetical protein